MPSSDTQFKKGNKMGILLGAMNGRWKGGITKSIKYNNKYSKKWKENNSEKVKITAKKWREKNKKKMSILTKNWKIKNPDKIRQYKHFRRIKRVENGGSHTYHEWETLKAQYNWTCPCCKKIGIKLTRDHIIPVSKGGSDNIENIQPLCLSCNDKKYTKIIKFDNCKL